MIVCSTHWDPCGCLKACLAVTRGWCFCAMPSYNRRPQNQSNLVFLTPVTPVNENNSKIQYRQRFNSLPHWNEHSPSPSNIRKDATPNFAEPFHPRKRRSQISVNGCKDSVLVADNEPGNKKKRPLNGKESLQLQTFPYFDVVNILHSTANILWWWSSILQGNQYQYLDSLVRIGILIFCIILNQEKDFIIAVTENQFLILFWDVAETFDEKMYRSWSFEILVDWGMEDCCDLHCFQWQPHIEVEPRATTFEPVAKLGQKMPTNLTAIYLWENTTVPGALGNSMEKMGQ